MIEIFFLNMIAAISDSWLWLGPLLVICVLILTVCEVKDVFKDILKDMEEPEVGDQRSDV